MSEVKVNKISPRSGTTVTLGDSGDTFTIPSGVSITNQGTASGFGSTGEVSWVTTKKTTTFTVTSGEGYFCDTSSGGFTVNLPAGTAGNSFAVADYTNTFQTGNLTISPNGSQKIGGVAADATLSTEGQSAYFVYVDDTEGWKNVIDSTSNLIGSAFIAATGGTITTCGNCKVHTFTGPGTFAVSAIALCAANNKVSHIVVAGGAAGGSGDNGGGGGAGGFREAKSPVTPYTASPLDGGSPNAITVTAASFPITVGSGGASNTAPPPVAGGNGSPSIFSTITSAGGGGGGSGANPGAGSSGGSGGGGGYGTPGAGGSGNTPPVSPSQGNNGGNGNTSTPAYGTGGGGGAGAVGGNGSNPSAGNGGAGVSTSINFSSTAYAGGGGGNTNLTCTPAGTGGTGGGGTGVPGASQPDAAIPGIANGTANTGGGGGSVDETPTFKTSGNGGSGIVIVRYKYQ
jgi:hypothetical protein